MADVKNVTDLYKKQYERVFKVADYKSDSEVIANKNLQESHISNAKNYFSLLYVPPLFFI